ncbi:protein TOC75, putative [Plasmodium berghei]|uniref:Protein TOC75, putative n=2 Tax=Plasmodium berghei TaxID=5821 RepID=A0A509B1A3_PLABA|nr:protein TOC75, putative [Plasmodium berghei ANKA]CXJ25366.1 protein TOC75, putative [Plasmodium berghei]SCM26859.1 protein TOC75, putative [Plasmodium berghei]SCN28672.1 protein TOC75, putative [Plasmodium berghei]SCO62896.1 protein TOC75, putative [Plasmodium berghei]SCO64420.1 protein TOC75, putative [Plasmodium berghei]|eukprot:XP_034424317.1 protein TOC75, putative [Plasmodium berghei ANKA]
MKNVSHFYKYIILIILIYILANIKCNKIKKIGYNNICNKLYGNYHNENQECKYKKVNLNKLFYLENTNKLKEIWERIKHVYIRDTKNVNDKIIKTNSDFHSFKNSATNFTGDNNEIINNVIINNSTIIDQNELSNLLKRNNLITIRHKDINQIIKIINEYYIQTNHIFSTVLKYEIKNENDKKTLIIYVNEVILDKNCIKVNVYKEVGKKNETKSVQTEDEYTSEKTGKEELLKKEISNVELSINLPNIKEKTIKNSSVNNVKEIIFERENILSKDILQYELSVKKKKYCDQVKKMFEKKMNIKESSIFVWDEKMYDLLIKSNLFKYIHVRLTFDKSINKHILEIDLVENKSMMFIPSISKSFNSMLEFCINLTFSYLHSLNFSDKFRIKYFQNLNYKNNKHNYDIIFVNDTIEIEKLKNNFPSYSIYGFNTNKVYKKELNNSCLNDFTNIINSQCKKKDEENSERNNSNKEQNILKGFIQTKDIYNYLHTNKFFIFYIKKIHNTIFELKVKIKKNILHNFLYFLKTSSSTLTSQSSLPSEDTKVRNNSKISKMTQNFLISKYNYFIKRKTNNVLLNKLYNIYGATFKCSLSLNACSSNIFEKTKFLNTFFNLKNKIDLIFHFNTNNNFSIKSFSNISLDKNGNSTSKRVNTKSFYSYLLSYFKDINKEKYYDINKINNIHLNYTFYFNKNYKIPISKYVLNLKNILKRKKLNNQDEEIEKEGGNTQHIIRNNIRDEVKLEKPFPWNFINLNINDIQLLINLEFSLTKNLWNYKGINISNNNSRWFEKKVTDIPYAIINKLFNMNNEKNAHNNLENFKENIEKVEIYKNDLSESSKYNIHNVNINDAINEHLNKIGCSLNYKLIFPILFNNYFLNLTNMRLYLFLNYNLFNKPQKNRNISIPNNQNKNIATSNFLKLNYLKKKQKKKQIPSYGFGIIISNINIFMNFKINSKNMLPSLVMQLNQDISKFKYLL